ncbi:MAG: hypothetical protein HYV35_07900, partial [Lentisphaerae bacterium]|nr:hypothetical protein [Lentisphaerota bacterium]
MADQAQRLAGHPARRGTNARATLSAWPGGACHAPRVVKPAPRFAGLATRFAWLIVLALACAPMASATDYFVATNGSDAAAGTSWATALLTISNAVAKTASDDTVTVSNGTYNITNQISITNGITVQSLNGATNAIVNGGGSVRCFYVSHTNAVVDGFTITNGYLASGN